MVSESNIYKINLSTAVKLTFKPEATTEFNGKFPRGFHVTQSDQHTAEAPGEQPLTLLSPPCQGLFLCVAIAYEEPISRSEQYDNYCGQKHRIT